MTLEETGELIGMTSLFAFHWQHRRCAIGDCLGRPWWGHGQMHEALTALVDYGFRELGLNRIEADVDPRNTGPVKSLERLGFEREGLLRERWIVEGAVADTGFYGLLRRKRVAADRAAGYRPIAP